jgi:short chain dehydrogenase
MIGDLAHDGTAWIVILVGRPRRYVKCWLHAKKPTSFKETPAYFDRHDWPVVGSSNRRASSHPTASRTFATASSTTEVVRHRVRAAMVATKQPEEDPIRLDGKTALVAGGTSGIGEATAVAFAGAGAKVTIVSRDKARARAVCARIDAAGGGSLFVRADVRDAEDYLRAGAWPLLEPLEARLRECRQILLAGDVRPCHVEPLRGRLLGLGDHHGPVPVALRSWLNAAMSSAHHRPSSGATRYCRPNSFFKANLSVYDNE